MSLATRVRLLRFAAAVVIVFGFVMATSPALPTGALVTSLAHLAFWPSGVTAPLGDPAGWLVTAIAGGVLVGWGLMCWLVTPRVYALQPQVGRPILLTSLLAWFVVDGAGSLLAGAWFNLVLNGGFLALFLVPLMASAPAVARPSVAR